MKAEWQVGNAIHVFKTNLWLSTFHIWQADFKTGLTSQLWLLFYRKS